MKIAICISGIPKFWANSLNSVKKYFPGADIFIHTWCIDKADINKNTVYSLNSYEGLDTNIGDIINSFKPIKILVEDFSSKSEAWLKQKQHYEDRGILYVHDNSISLLSMHYSIEQAFKLKIEHEKIVGKQYDFAVCMRFDSDIKTWDANVIDYTAINIPVGNDYAERGINNQFSCGNNELMNKLSRCYSSLDNVIIATNMYNPETNFAHYLHEIGIYPDKLKRSDITVNINNR